MGHFLRNQLDAGKITIKEFYKLNKLNKLNQMDELTYGQKAVGANFNPSGNVEVDSLKDVFAHIIDHMDDLRSITSDLEVKRMASIAITEAQTACMWAVKAVTYK